VTNQV